MTPAERAELREMERRWVDYLSAPSLGISDCRRELLEFLARHSGGEAAESEEDTNCVDCGRAVCRRDDCAVFSEVGQALCIGCYANTPEGKDEAEKVRAKMLAVVDEYRSRA